MPEELSPVLVALSRQLRADFSADLLTFCAKWQDNIAREGLARECGIIMSIPLMDAAIGHVVAMEIIGGKYGKLSRPLLDYGQQQADKAWGAREHISKELGKEIMEMLARSQKR